MKPILAVRDLKVHFPLAGGLFMRRMGAVRAVDGVSFDIAPGETLGLVGESGCGKSTLGKAIVRLTDANAGTIHFDGRDITKLGRREMRPLRRDIQMIFQDPVESLNARHSVREILEEPLIIHGIGSAMDRRQRVDEVLERVGLQRSAAERYPFEFSGGQRQRIGIARAIILRPRLIICDEPVSALDVSVQSQVLNLLLELQRDMGLSYLFIAHDLAVVKHISDRVAVMYLGKIVELAGADAIYRRPRHAYTKALLSAIPEADPTRAKERILLEGDVPSPIDPPAGSAFGHRIAHPRYGETVGLDLSPRELEPGHWIAPDPCCVESEELARLGINGPPKAGS
ncbi:MAG: ATP-binding cassette domain-containing protein [Verrucomicrobia bacterium]|nr:MAG: ATP-binding cassette domain-containing protein [Verrucomicrobiota bacterium]TAE86120.1 MAG: ATP-binding cassette domain-containing protein [Verrucomicrobiota bacterium]TAF23467.1 MAG: ATP-binding cassette domain-containing protein [Verrucomicrobiota bacterium]TAF40097.1 MAG: ATP-binding cassette domain-containing protein [Verrucomicrobiota bacterium]